MKGAHYSQKGYTKHFFNQYYEVILQILSKPNYDAGG